MGILDIFKSQNQKDNNTKVSSEKNFGVKEIEALIEKGTPCADAIKNASRFIEERDMENILNNFAVNKEDVENGVIFTFEDEGKLNLTSDGALTRVKNKKLENINEISKLVEQVNQELPDNSIKETQNLTIKDEYDSSLKEEVVEEVVQKEVKKRPAFKRR